ncbi:MAG TPA: PEP-CTERM sorting domain-containing protein [Steroidobacteraceae bacterium]
MHISTGASIALPQPLSLIRCLERFCKWCALPLILLFAVSNPATATIVYTSGGFFDTGGCDPVSCAQTGTISDARQHNTESVAGFELGSASIIDGFSWIGDNFGKNQFTLRIYDAKRGSDANPFTDPFYEFAIGTSYVASPLEYASGVAGGTLFSSDIAPIILPADHNFFVSIQATQDSTSQISWAWYTGPHTSKDDRLVRDDFNPGQWQRTLGKVEAFQFSGFRLPVAVPEPSSFILFAMGLALLAIREVRTPRRVSRRLG